MKYSIEREKRKYSNAGSKAVRDMNAILHDSGYVPYVFDSIYSNRWVYSINRFFRVLYLLLLLKKGDICFLQWPIYSRIDRVLYAVLKNKRVHLQLLIHDLASIRLNKFEEYEKKFLLFADTIIVHTSAMKDLIVSWGVEESRIRILTSFDYLVYDNDLPTRKMSNDVAFAGNLSKSKFLQKIEGNSIGIQIFCYGSKVRDLSKPLIYKGKFDADYVSGIEGSWGLVWDGNDVDTCSGILGDYLRINSPHKVSLYIVSKLPIIIWKEAALADYVQTKGLGVVVDSLLDIPSVLSEISESKYCSILENLERERKELIAGMHLKQFLK